VREVEEIEGRIKQVGLIRIDGKKQMIFANVNTCENLEGVFLDTLVWSRKWPWSETKMWAV